MTKSCKRCGCTSFHPTNGRCMDCLAEEKARREVRKAEAEYGKQTLPMSSNRIPRIDAERERIVMEGVAYD